MFIIPLKIEIKHNKLTIFGLTTRGKRIIIMIIIIDIARKGLV